MTNFATGTNGLLVPVEKKRKARCELGPLELRDEEARGKAQQALGQLWDAMDLVQGHGHRGIQLTDEPSVIRRAAYYELHKHMGKALLGRDYAGGEEWT